MHGCPPLQHIGPAGRGRSAVLPAWMTNPQLAQDVKTSESRSSSNSTPGRVSAMSTSPTGNGSLYSSRGDPLHNTKRSSGGMHAGSSSSATSTVEESTSRETGAASGRPASGRSTTSGPAGATKAGGTSVPSSYSSARHPPRSPPPLSPRHHHYHSPPPPEIPVSTSKSSGSSGASAAGNPATAEPTTSAALLPANKEAIARRHSRRRNSSSTSSSGRSSSSNNGSGSNRDGRRDQLKRSRRAEPISRSNSHGQIVDDRTSLGTTSTNGNRRGGGTKSYNRDNADEKLVRDADDLGKSGPHGGPVRARLSPDEDDSKRRRRPLICHLDDERDSADKRQRDDQLPISPRAMPRRTSSDRLRASPEPERATRDTAAASGRGVLKRDGSTSRDGSYRRRGDSRSCDYGGGVLRRSDARSKPGRPQRYDSPDVRDVESRGDYERRRPRYSPSDVGSRRTSGVPLRGSPEARRGSMRRANSRERSREAQARTTGESSSRHAARRAAGSPAETHLGARRSAYSPGDYYGSRRSRNHNAPEIRDAPPGEKQVGRVSSRPPPFSSRRNGSQSPPVAPVVHRSGAAPVSAGSTYHSRDGTYYSSRGRYATRSRSRSSDRDSRRGNGYRDLRKEGRHDGSHRDARRDDPGLGDSFREGDERRDRRRAERTREDEWRRDDRRDDRRVERRGESRVYGDVSCGPRPSSRDLERPSGLSRRDGRSESLLKASSRCTVTAESRRRSSSRGTRRSPARATRSRSRSRGNRPGEIDGAYEKPGSGSIRPAGYPVSPTGSRADKSECANAVDSLPGSPATDVSCAIICERLQDLRSMASGSERENLTRKFVSNMIHPEEFSFESTGGRRSSVTEFMNTVVKGAVALSKSVEITRRVVIEQDETYSYCVELEWHTPKLPSANPGPGRNQSDHDKGDHERLSGAALEPKSIISLYSSMKGRLIRCFQFREAPELTSPAAKDVDFKKLRQSRKWCRIHKYLLKKGVAPTTICFFHNYTTTSNSEKAPLGSTPSPPEAETDGAAE